MLEFVVWVVNERCSHVEDNAWLRRQRVVWLARDGIDSGKEYIFVYNLKIKTLKNIAKAPAID